MGARSSVALLAALAVAAVGCGGSSSEGGPGEAGNSGAPVEGNGYAQDGDRVLPGSWRRALMVAERSPFLRDALGEEFMKIFLAIKQQECARFLAEVSELDYAWYLRN